MEKTMYQRWFELRIGELRKGMCVNLPQDKVDEFIKKYKDQLPQPEEAHTPKESLVILCINKGWDMFINIGMELKEAKDKDMSLFDNIVKKYNYNETDIVLAIEAASQREQASVMALRN